MTLSKHPAIRSKKNTQAARSQPCTLRFVGVCQDNDDHETSVFAHIHDASFGMGMKADDISGCDACNACHMFLDHGWVGKISETIRLRHIIQGLQETLRNRIERGIIFIQQDKAKVYKPRPRKPKSQRAPLNSRKDFWLSRQLKSRNTLRKEANNVD